MGYTKQIAIILVFCVFLAVDVFAEYQKIDGLYNTAGGSVYCDYNNLTNNCTFESIDGTYFIYSVTPTIKMAGQSGVNLVIPSNIKFIIQNPNSWFPGGNSIAIQFNDFNSIRIKESKSLTIDNNSFSPMDLSFVDVATIIVPNNSKLIITDNKPINFSDILKDNEFLRYDTNYRAMFPDKVISIKPGTISLNDTILAIDGNLTIDLNKTVYLSHSLANCGSTDTGCSEEDCLAGLISAPFIGMIYPKPPEEDDDSEVEDNNESTESDDTDYEEEEYICYKYFWFTSCKWQLSGDLSAYRPQAFDENSAYLCFDFPESKAIEFMNINAGNQSHLSITTNLNVYRNIPADERYYLGDELQSTYESFEPGEEPFMGQADIVFEDYSGKLPKTLDNQGRGSITLQTCGPINPLPLPKQTTYNTCRFVLSKPYDILNDFNDDYISGIKNYFIFPKQCAYSNISDQISNYLMVESTQDISPFVFGSIQKASTGQSITPQFTITSPSYGLFDINVIEQRQSNIGYALRDNFFIFYLYPSKEQEMNLLTLYQFKFRLDANADYNYPDINLYYPFRLYK